MVRIQRFDAPGQQGTVAPPVGDRHVERDPVHPGRQLGAGRVVAIERAPKLHADLLRQVAAILQVAGVDGRHLENNPAMLVQQRLERR